MASRGNQEWNVLQCGQRVWVYSCGTRARVSASIWMPVENWRPVFGHLTSSTPITTFPLVSKPHRTSSQLNWSAVKMIATKTSPTISRPNIFFSPYTPRFCLGQSSPAYVSRCAARHKNIDCIGSSIPNCRHDCVRTPAIAQLMWRHWNRRFKFKASVRIARLLKCAMAQPPTRAGTRAQRYPYAKTWNGTWLAPEYLVISGGYWPPAP